MDLTYYEQSIFALITIHCFQKKNFSWVYYKLSWFLSGYDDILHHRNMANRNEDRNDPLLKLGSKMRISAVVISNINS